MRRKDQMLLGELSQDPLMTILAVVLLSTIWLLIPSAGKPAEIVAEAEGRMLDLEARKKALEQQLDNLRAEEERLRKIESDLAPRSPPPGTAPSTTSVAELRKELEDRLRALRELQGKLEQARSALPPVEERIDPEAVRERIEDTKRKIQQAQALLAELQSKIDSAETQKAEVARREESVRDEMAHLETARNALEAEISRLKREPPAEALGLKGGRYQPVHETTKKEERNFELVKGVLYPVDNDHYEGSFVMLSGGKMAFRSSLKSSARGDSITDLESPGSQLLKTLQQLDPKKVRVKVWVRSDSFALLRVVREVVTKRGFELGWWPDDSEYFYSGSPEGFTMPTTSTPPPQ